MECQRRKVASIPGPRSNPASVPITVVRTFTRGGSYHVSPTPILRFASQVSMVFKGRHNRKFLLTRGRTSATARPDFSPPLPPRNAREIRGKEKVGNAPKREGLEEIRLPPAPCVSVVSRVLSPFPPQKPAFFLFPQSRDLFSPFFSLFSGQRYFSRLTTVHLHTVCRINRKETRRRCRAGRKSSRDETDVEADALQILKISSPLITARFFIYPSHVLFFAS